MSVLINALKIIFLLGFLVFIHEGGHFLAARLFKVKVEEFSIGFGPKIFTKKGKETVYRIGCIPFGGYEKMTGETERSEEEGAFNNAKLWHRIVIVAAGAIVNIVFAILMYFIISCIFVNNASTTISEILPEAKENLAELQVGDKILEINNTKIRLKSDISKALRNYTDGEINIIVERNNENVEVKGTPIKYNEMYILGIQVTELENVTIGDRLYYAYWQTIEFSNSMVYSLKMLFTGKVGLDQMTGPIGISKIVSKQNSIYNFLQLLCLVSLSLGVTNLLPIPALDGGRILLLIIEGIRGKALKEEVELGIQSIGFLLLIMISIYVSYQDVLRIF